MNKIFCFLQSGRLFVRNLWFGVTEQELENIFGKYGEQKKCLNLLLTCDLLICKNKEIVFQLEYFINLVCLSVCSHFPQPPKVPASWNYLSRRHLGQLKNDKIDSIKCSVLQILVGGFSCVNFIYKSQNYVFVYNFKIKKKTQKWKLDIILNFIFTFYTN